MAHIDRGRIAGASTLALISLVGCGDGEAGTATGDPDQQAANPGEWVTPEGSPHLILISLDTLRADHMSVYGYAKPTTPGLEAFGRGATVYENARASAPWTLPSHASMFTGLHPFEHGAHTYPIEKENIDPRGNAAVLDTEFQTLAEALQANGYETAGFVANVTYLSTPFQLNQGFETYSVQRVPAAGINAQVFDWLESRDPSAPFFLFLNYLDTHRPYYCVGPGEETPYGTPKESAQLLKDLYPLIFEPPHEAPEEDLERLRNQYDHALMYLDGELTKLFSHLDERGILNDALVVVTSDHGEFFGEHRLIEHSKDVYEPVLHVPLIVKAPGQREGRRATEMISHVHVPGLILSHARLTQTPTELASFFAFWPPGGDVLAENYFSRIHDLVRPWGDRFQRVRRALYADGFKYVHSSDGQHELYALDEDPGELNNLIEERPDLAREMAQRLMRRLERPQAAPGKGAELDEELIQRMKDLGYLGDDE